MGWEDRPYYRDRRSAMGGLWWLLNGSIPLFRAFGIRVRMHASLLLFIILTIILGGATKDYDLGQRVLSMGVLFTIILLHEFGHCFACRSVGGTADDILMHPFGGLAMCDPPRRPLATFWTVAGGPLVNVVICVIAAVAVYSLTPTAFQLLYAHNGGTSAHHVVESLNPFSGYIPTGLGYTAAAYCHWVFKLSYILLLFNLLPIFPLDGGQMLQTILWPTMGYFRSMYLSTIVGMVGAVALALFGLYQLEIFVICVAVLGFFYCRAKRAELLESSDGGLLMGSMDYGASIYAQPAPRKRRRLSGRAIRRGRKIAAQERAERDTIDRILAKVSAKGMHNLTWWERRTLRQATEKQRKRDEELQRLGMGE
jgi:Zn-dependent protease